MDLFAARGLDDLVLLDHIDEDSVANTLKQRFVSESQIYTYIGPVLVAVNPYKILTRNGKSIYDESVMDQYRGRVYYELPPSVFAVAENAYSSILRFRKPASVIISGESGAGKTETARQVLAYLARVSGAYLANVTSKMKTVPHGAAAAKKTRMQIAIDAAMRVKDRLVTSTLVTEALGNAKTTRNDNSSRFGKLMTVNFRGNGIAAGGSVQIYLLEKNRVVRQAEGDRSYHAFYYLLAGASPDLKRTLRLEAPEAYNYLSNEYRKVTGVNDALQFRALTACMNMLGMTEKVQQSIWRVLAVVLHLGNVEFTSEGEREAAYNPDADVDDFAGGSAGAGATGGKLNAHAATVDMSGPSGTALHTLATLLGVSEEGIEHALTHRSIRVGGTTTETLQTTAQARAARDALAKSIYEKLFDYTVEQVNLSISSDVPVPPAGGHAPGASHERVPSVPGSPEAAEPPLTDPEDDSLAMHILDLYGFEIFEVNRFEQLCINYVNERLQQLFIEATLRSEQDEYEREGITWEPIPYFDNQVVVQLLEQRAGVFALLDDACAMADASATKLVTSLNGKLGKHAHYHASRMQDGTFTVKHYAGDVTYHAEGMVVANRDLLSNDLIKLMNSSAATPLLGTMFADNRTEEQKSKRPPTAGFQFRTSVNALISVLSECMPNYVRCIKPNDLKKPATVNDERFVHQIRYLGLVESTRVKRAGFAYRASYDEFLRRYRMLSKVTWPPKATGDEEGVRQLIASIHVWEKPKNETLGVGVGSTAKGAPAGGGGRLGMAGSGMPARGGAAAPASALLGAEPGKGMKTAFSALPGDVALPGSYKLVEGKDFQYGATKIFLKAPKTLFALEYMRLHALGKIASRVAALWRGYMGKRNYARIKVAWAKQAAHVKAHLQRKRYLRMKAAATRISSIARGYLTRRSHEVRTMRESLGMITFHGKIRRRKSLSWPSKPHNDYLGILMPGTTSVSTAGAKLAASLARARPPQAAAGIVYSDTVLKIKQNYKMLKRGLVVTDFFVINLADPWSKGKINRAIRIPSLGGISLSPHRDSYVVLHVRGEHDYACICETKTALVTALCERFRALTGTELMVRVTPDITYRAFKRDSDAKMRHIQFQQVADPSIFASHVPEPWETELAPISVMSDVTAAAGEGAAAPALSTVQRAHMQAEQQTTFHTLAGDGHAIVVSVPVPPKVKLADMLTEREKEKMRRKGVRCLGK